MDPLSLLWLFYIDIDDAEAVLRAINGTRPADPSRSSFTHRAGW